MSLNWDIVDCHFSDKFQEQNWDIIEQTIWSTMLVDMGSVTKANIDKYEFRLRCYEKVGGARLSGVIEFLPNMIGLTTNVRTITDRAFEKKLSGIVKYEVQYAMRLARKEKKESDDKRSHQEAT